MSLPTPKEEPPWPPQATETIPFTGREAQGLLSRSKSRARVVAVGANGDLERAPALLSAGVARVDARGQPAARRAVALADLSLEAVARPVWRVEDDEVDVVDLQHLQRVVDALARALEAEPVGSGWSFEDMHGRR